MLSKLSVSVLLKTVIIALSGAVVFSLSVAAWSAWTRLAQVRHIESVAVATRDLFTGLHNLRVDRSLTSRDLGLDRQFPDGDALIAQFRAADLKALTAAVAHLRDIDFPNRGATLSALDESVKTLASRQQQAVRALALPKSERPAALAAEYMNEGNALLELLQKTLARLTSSVKLQDAYVGQLMAMNQLAWMARMSGGDIASTIDNTLSGVALPKDAAAQFAANVAKVETQWEMLRHAAEGIPLTRKLQDAFDKAKDDYFGAEHLERRATVIDALLRGRSTPIEPGEWTKYSVAKLGSLLGVAEAALESAQDYAAEQNGHASRALWTVLALLALALVVTAAAVALVSRRVSGPLRAIEGAMLKIAGGDFAVVLPGLDRKDEIGNVANAVERFKVLADQKARAETAELVERQRAESERAMQAAQAEAAAQARIASERAKAAEEQSAAVSALADSLRKLAQGDLTVRLTGAFPEAYAELRDDFNATLVKLHETVGALVAVQVR